MILCKGLINETCYFLITDGRCIQHDNEGSCEKPETVIAQVCVTSKSEVLKFALCFRVRSRSWKINRNKLILLTVFLCMSFSSFMSFIFSGFHGLLKEAKPLCEAWNISHCHGFVFVASAVLFCKRVFCDFCVVDPLTTFSLPSCYIWKPSCRFFFYLFHLFSGGVVLTSFVFCDFNDWLLFLWWIFFIPWPISHFDILLTSSLCRPKTKTDKKNQILVLVFILQWATTKYRTYHKYLLSSPSLWAKTETSSNLIEKNTNRPMTS